MLPRFSDRDLLMREHWGLGVGHLYARNANSTDAMLHKAVTLEQDDEHQDPDVRDPISMEVDGPSNLDEELSDPDEDLDDWLSDVFGDDESVDEDDDEDDMDY